MANYQSQYTGAQIDEAVGKALAGGSRGYSITFGTTNALFGLSIAEICTENGSVTSVQQGETISNVIYIKCTLTNMMIDSPYFIVFKTDQYYNIVSEISFIRGGGISSGSYVLIPLSDGTIEMD